MVFNKNQDYWADISINDEFIIIETQSGLGRVGVDPDFPQFILDFNADDELIGKTILEALSKSRTLNDLEDRRIFFDIDRCKDQYKKWVSGLMINYGYKTRKSLFLNMRKCSVHLMNGVITISPTIHEKLESWSEVVGGDVVLSLDDSLKKLGEGFRMALGRCKE